MHGMLQLLAVAEAGVVLGTSFKRHLTCQISHKRAIRTLFDLKVSRTAGLRKAPVTARTRLGTNGAVTTLGSRLDFVSYGTCHVSSKLHDAFQL